MQLNQPVQNPAFISKLKQFDTNKTRKDELELIEEMRKMHYITPVTLDPSPEEGKPNQQTQVKFRAATTTKGRASLQCSPTWTNSRNGRPTQRTP